MKTSIFLIEYNDKEVSGYQTFRDELLSGLQNDSSITIGNITIDSDFKSLTIYIDHKTIKVYVPKIIGHYKYERIAASLKLYIPDLSTNIFLCNFTPASELLKSLETFYPLSKRALILHDFIAAYYLQGKLNLYHKFISTKSDNISYPPIGDISLSLLRTLHDEYEKAFRSVHKLVCLCEDTIKLISNEFNVPHEKIVLINNGLSDYFQGSNTPGTNGNQFKDSKCKDCLLLPVCSGGCPKYRMMNKYEGKEIDVCPLIKHDLDEFLYLHFLHKTGETC